MVDGRGAAHEFRFRTRLFGPGVAIDAFELRDGSPAGYEFQVIGEPDDDPLELRGWQFKLAFRDRSDEV